MFNPHLTKVLLIALVMTILYIPISYAQELSPVSILKKNRNAIYTLVDKSKKRNNILGFSFAINSDGLVLSNTHIIGTNNFVVVGANNKVYEVEKLVFKDSKRDLVLFQLSKAKNIPSVVLGNSKDLKIGNKIIALVGYNKGDLIPKNAIVGKLINIPAKEQNKILLESTFKISSMMEGTPLFDTNGKVVGILSSANDDTEIIGTAGIAINDLHRYKNHIKSFLKDSSEPIKLKKVKFKEKAVTHKDKKVKRSLKKPTQDDNKVSENTKTTDVKVKLEQKKEKKSFLERLFHFKKTKKKPRTAKTEHKQLTTLNDKERKNKLKKKPTKNKTLKTDKTQLKPEKKKNFLARIFRIKRSEKKPRQAKKEKVDKTLIASSSDRYDTVAQTSSSKKIVGIDLTGYWFDIYTGLNLYLEQKGNTITMQNSNSSLLQTKTKSSQGKFKKQGDIFVGYIESTIICSNNYHAKVDGKNTCSLKEPAEIVSWNDDKIDLRVNTTDDYTCRMCVNPTNTTWKHRTLLRKVFKD